MNEDLSRKCTRSHPHENMDCCCNHKTEIARLTNHLSAITAERDEAKEEFEIVKQQHLHAIKEVSSLRARIAEAEPVGVGARWPTDLDKRILYLLWNDGEIEEAVYNGMEAVKLYAVPTPSPDTAELIRNAVEEEREACAKICEEQEAVVRIEGAHEEYIIGRQMGSQVCANLIRSRSTKEK